MVLKNKIHIVHRIHSNRSENRETRGVFLVIEVAFDTIPHYLLLYKLKAYGLGTEAYLLISYQIVGYGSWSTIPFLTGLQ
jgi:hypothetical protein